MTGCEGVNKDGSRCAAIPHTGSPYCFFHDPTKEKELLLAKARGGFHSRKNPQLAAILDDSFLDDTSPEKLQKLLLVLSKALIQGKIEASTLNSVTRAVNAITQLSKYEVSP